ncbi:MAG: bifunctional methylenetetrahydrofolate dehydrogenase/methenyltetrahydrofolate cyclohydrolase FolD [Hyphomicrobiaceae bacterium]
MSSAQIIDGKAIAERVRNDVAAAVSGLRSAHGFTPGLAVVLVGEDPASQVYVRSKGKQTEAAGMVSLEHKLDAATPEQQLLDLISQLNRDPAVDGILVQLPLPAHISSKKVLEAIDPAKDVDGFHPMNVGRLSAGERALVPCTPAGCVILAKSVTPRLGGMEAVIVGRSNIVGKPMAQLLLAEDCTVTIAHSRTRDLPAVVARADLLVAAVGRPEMIKGSWIKPDTIVIDVGINRIPAEAGKSRLVGDVEFKAAAERAAAITPVPGGVGPMTIACLLRNTVQAACARHGLASPMD